MLLTTKNIKTITNQVFSLVSEGIKISDAIVHLNVDKSRFYLLIDQKTRRELIEEEVAVRTTSRDKFGLALKAFFPKPEPEAIPETPKPKLVFKFIAKLVYLKKFQEHWYLNGSPLCSSKPSINAVLNYWVRISTVRTELKRLRGLHVTIEDHDTIHFTIEGDDPIPSTIEDHDTVHLLNKIYSRVELNEEEGYILLEP